MILEGQNKEVKMYKSPSFFWEQEQSFQHGTVYAYDHKNFNEHSLYGW